MIYLRAHGDKIVQQFTSVFREHRFRVKLHAVDGISDAESHDVSGDPRRSNNLESRQELQLRNDTCQLSLVKEVSIDTCRIMCDGTRHAVHGPHLLTLAPSKSYRLMPQTDT